MNCIFIIQVSNFHLWKQLTMLIGAEKKEGWRWHRQESWELSQNKRNTAGLQLQIIFVVLVLQHRSKWRQTGKTKGKGRKRWRWPCNTLPQTPHCCLCFPLTCTSNYNPTQRSDTNLNPFALVALVRSGVDSWLPEGGGGQGLPQDIPPTERGLLGYGE